MGNNIPGYIVVIHIAECTSLGSNLTVKYNSSQAIAYQVSPRNGIILYLNSSFLASDLAYVNEQHNLVIYTSVAQPNGHVPDSNPSVVVKVTIDKKKFEGRTFASVGGPPNPFVTEEV